MATSNIPTPVGHRPERPMHPAMRRRAALRPRPSKWAPFLRIAPAIILVIGLLLPVEVRLNLADQTLYGYRLAWMLVAPWMLYQMLSGRYQFRFNDALVVLACMWIVLAFVIVAGLSSGFPSGIAIALDILVPYLVVRVTIRTPDDFRFLLIAMAPIVFVIGGLMVLEAFTHFRFIRSGAQAVFGSLGAAEYGDVLARTGTIDTRFGLLRAMGPFSHPILAGVFFVGLLPIYYFSKLRGWPMLAGLAAGITAVFSFSSAALLGLAIFVGLAAYDRLRNMIVFLTWPMFIAFASLTMITLQLITQNGLISVMIRYTMNPASGYYRLLIWEYGSRSVERHPFFGIGFNSFERLPWMLDSVDTIWLSLAMRHGLPTALLIGLSVLLAIVGLARAASANQSINRSMYVGLAITLSIFAILGFTVSFFGGLFIWFVMLLGIGTTFGSLTNPKPRRMVARRPVRAPVSAQ